jgi:hypothetical protein
LCWSDGWEVRVAFDLAIYGVLRDLGAGCLGVNRSGLVVGWSICG